MEIAARYISHHTPKRRDQADIVSDANNESNELFIETDCNSIFTVSRFRSFYSSDGHDVNGSFIQLNCVSGSEDTFYSKAFV